MFWPENPKRSFNVQRSIQPRISGIASDPDVFAVNDGGGQGNGEANMDEEKESVQCEVIENAPVPEVASTKSTFEYSEKESNESGISVSGIYDSFSDDTEEETFEETNNPDKPIDGEDENWMRNEVEKTKRRIFNYTDENAGDIETEQSQSPTAPHETQTSPATSQYFTAPTTRNVTMVEEDEGRETPQFDTTAEEMMLFAVS